MECNKDEAIRAREIAEKKMQNSDFDGAKRLALKAQQLYANLDNISMILAVCEVHCSAQNKIIGSDANWYDVLQIDKMADETTIKKQYRKLALLLHPDKNKFAGAEAAFKLIGEANRVLSNKITRSAFDLKMKAFMKTSTLKSKPPSHPSSGSSFVSKQQNTHNSVNKSANQQSMANGTHQKSSSFHMGREASGRAANNNGVSDKHSVRNSMPAPPTKAGYSFSNTKQKSNDVDSVCLDARKKGPKSDVKKPVMAKASRTRNKKRGKPGIVESSQSSDGVGDADVEAEVNQENGNSKLEDNYDARKPSGLKRNVSYTGSLYDEGEFNKSPKMPKTMHSDKEAHIEKELKDDDGNAFATTMNGVENDAKQYDGTSDEGNLPKKKRKLKKQSDNSVEEDEVCLFEEEDSDIEIDDSPVSYKCADPDFSDFDKDKEKNCFDVNQIWASYDTVEAMPRFYARVRRVLSKDFKLEITWLEPVAQGDSYTKWANKGLPIACGTFRYGHTEVATSHLMFSHQMCHESGKTRYSFVIYPQAGETWALFRNWDISWANDPEKHKPYKYDFVVILSDFDQKDGVKVAYLKKLRGFASLFQRVTQKGEASFQIPPGNLYQFSHRIPSFRMSGTERDDVPEGSYELDPASLPDDIDELVDFTHGKVGNESNDTTGDISFKQSTESCENLRTAAGRVETNGTSKKHFLDDANKNSTEVKRSKAFPKEDQHHGTGTEASNQENDITPRKPTTVIRRSPRSFSSKKRSN
ncbi:unnamed protein product [Rhodiola kirilowii]